MTSSTSGGDDKVVAFPSTAEERRALLKAKQDQEKQRLINIFIDEAGSDQALFHTNDGVAFADLIIAGHRETWPVRSRQFRNAYVRYLRQQFDRLIAEGAALQAWAVKSGMKKTTVNVAIDDFETRAICSPTVRDVHIRVAGDRGDVYIDLGDDTWQAVRVTSASWSIVESPPVRFQRTPGMLPLPMPARGSKIEALRPFLNVMDFRLRTGRRLPARSPVSAWTSPHPCHLRRARRSKNQLSTHSAKPH